MSRVIAFFRNLFQRGRVERELDAELDAYSELVAAEKTAAGMSPDAARRAARLELEGSDHVKERVREVRAGALIEGILRDIRFGARSLRKTPGFTSFTVLTFALAIGGLTLIFSLVNAVLLKPLPFPDSNRLVTLLETDKQAPVGGYVVAAPNFFDWERQATSFQGMALYESLALNLSGDGEPEQVAGLRTTHRLFEILGVTPLLGRGFVAEDDAGANERVAVISWALWNRRYHGDSAIIGKNIRINQEPWQVIGVMPKGFGFPISRQAVWTPINLTENDRDRGAHSFWVVARLKDGITFEQGLAEIRAIGDRLSETYPANNARESATAIRLSDQWMSQTRSTLKALLVAVALVLLIAAANVASLLVARGHTRRRELAARMALGGTRGRIVSQILTESVLLSATGAVLGLLLASLGLKWFVSSVYRGLQSLPFRDLSSVGVDLSVFAVTAAVAIATGIIAGLAPALTVLPSEPGEVLRDSEGRGSTARRGRRLKNALVSVEVGLAVVVLVSAALLLASIRKLLRVEPGLDPVNVYLMEISLPQANFYGPAERTTFCEQAAAEAGTVPGVVAVSAVSHIPLTGASASRSFVIEGAPDPGMTPPWAQYGVICPGYFAAMGIPIRGRDFNGQDRRDGNLVVIINQALKDKYYKDQDPIGLRFRIGRFDTPSPLVTIVGVAGNVRHNGLQSEIQPYLYVPYQQAAWPSMVLVLKTASPGTPLAVPVRQALARFEPEAPVRDPLSMQNVVEDSLGHLRFPLTLFAIFAGLALALAATGIFGIASQTVQQRRRELGIRRALGARSLQLYGMVVGQTMVPVIIGVGLGIAGAFAGTRVIRSLLYGVSATNLPTFAIVAVVLAVVAVVACLAPARRAARVDPASVLRED